MARIIVEPASRGNDLSTRFVEALNLLNEKGIKLQSGTKLVSKYAVIVAEDPSKALEHLRARNIAAFVEPWTGTKIMCRRGWRTWGSRVWGGGFRLGHSFAACVPNPRHGAGGLQALYMEADLHRVRHSLHGASSAKRWTQRSLKKIGDRFEPPNAAGGPHLSIASV
jgi:hypothetical protein